MFIVQVFVKVRENDIDSFIFASNENGDKSLYEDGIVRFDVMQDIEEPQNFL